MKGTLCSVCDSYVSDFTNHKHTNIVCTYCEAQYSDGAKFTTEGHGTGECQKRKYDTGVKHANEKAVDEAYERNHFRHRLLDELKRVLGG